MAYSYLFFKPKLLPLVAEHLSEDTVESIVDLVEAQDGLTRVLPGLTWLPDGWARGESGDGNWLEFAIAPGGMLFMRCSFRASYAALVQRLCDTLGWIVVDQDPKVFLPNSEPRGV